MKSLISITNERPPILRAQVDEPMQHSPSSLADDVREPVQLPIDLLDEALMESFPCSDPPASTTCHI